MEGEITTLEQFASAMAGADESGQDEGGEGLENGQPEEEPQSEEQPGEANEEESQEETEEAEQPEVPESADDTVISWETASGEKFEVPVAELKQGYMRTQDYTQKTQQLATDRDTAQKHIEQQLGHIQAYAKDHGELYSTHQQIQQLESAIGQINQEMDPVAYSTAVSNLMLLRQHAGQVAGRIQQYAAHKAHESQEAVKTAQKKAIEELSGPNGIPGFGKELVQKWNKTGREYGFSDEELAATTDPRLLRVLNDAMRFRELEAKKPAAVSKVKTAPVKPAKQTTAAPASNIERDTKAFSANPSVENYARLLAQKQKG